MLATRRQPASAVMSSRDAGLKVPGCIDSRHDDRHAQGVPGNHVAARKAVAQVHESARSCAPFRGYLRDCHDLRLPLPRDDSWTTSATAATRHRNDNVTPDTHTITC